MVTMFSNFQVSFSLISPYMHSFFNMSLHIRSSKYDSTFWHKNLNIWEKNGGMTDTFNFDIKKEQVSCYHLCYKIVLEKKSHSENYECVNIIVCSLHSKDNVKL